MSLRKIYFFLIVLN
uniref:Uncharacterized protein n=1 Tax=Arundo donax TaxID=35708 RepID=A0A0A9A7B2_ARUDO